MSNTSDSRNIIIIYFRVLFGYIISFCVLFGILNIAIGLMSGWSINLLSSITSFPKETWIGHIGLFAISSFFSSLEIKRKGLGWFVYGLLLAGRLYFLTRPESEWNSLPYDIQFVWNFILIIHPIIHSFFAGKFVERSVMKPSRREYEEYLDAERYKYQEQIYRREYDNLTWEEKNALRDIKNIYDADDYAKRRIRG
jgi:hypothetical protein